MENYRRKCWWRRRRRFENVKNRFPLFTIYLTPSRSRWLSDGGAAYRETGCISRTISCIFSTRRGKNLCGGGDEFSDDLICLSRGGKRGCMLVGSWGRFYKLSSIELGGNGLNGSGLLYRLLIVNFVGMLKTDLRIVGDKKTRKLFEKLNKIFQNFEKIWQSWYFFWKFGKYCQVVVDIFKNLHYSTKFDK